MVDDTDRTQPAVEDSPDPEPEDDTDRVQPAVADADSLLDRAVEPEATAPASEPPDVETLERELEDAREQAQALRDQISAVMTAVGVDAPESSQDAVRMLGVLAAEGIHSRGHLIDACVEERVRAQGAAEFDSQGYRTRLTRLPIAELNDELRDLAGISGSVWTHQRQTATDIRRRTEADEQPPERILTAAELFALRGA